MIKLIIAIVFATGAAHAVPSGTDVRRKAEYYVQAYARHYGVPVTLVRSIVQ